MTSAWNNYKPERFIQNWTNVRHRRTAGSVLLLSVGSAPRRNGPPTSARFQKGFWTLMDDWNLLNLPRLRLKPDCRRWGRAKIDFARVGCSMSTQYAGRRALAHPGDQHDHSKHNGSMFQTWLSLLRMDIRGRLHLEHAISSFHRISGRHPFT